MNSMTGMGRARVKVQSTFFIVEAKSINHRFCEVNTRLPSRFQALELPIVQSVKKTVTRGKVDIWLGEERGETEIALNKKALKNYYGFLNEIRKELKLSDPINLSHIQSGSSFWMIKDNDVEKAWPAIQKALKEALDSMMTMRAKEGAQLKKQMQARFAMLEDLRKKVLSRKDVVILAYRDKIKTRLDKLLEGIAVDDSKLASEAAFFADKTEITEELDRLSSHFAQMTKLMGSKEPCGRPMDFLIQEINREWNTIGSKSQDIQISHWVVEAKTELEKVREQIQNIE